MSLLSVSHIDLDGIGCQIVLRQTFGEMQRMNINYEKVDEYLEIIEEYVYNHRPKEVFITDLSFTFKQLEKLKHITNIFKNTNFYFIDHHPFEEEYKFLNSDNFTIIITDKASATKLTYLFCKNNFNLNNRDLEKFVSYINAIDIWLKNTQEFKAGIVYNDLFFSYKIDYFWNKFKDNFNLSMKDKEHFKDLMVKKNKLFNKLENNGRIMKTGGDNKEIIMVFIDTLNTHIQLDYPDFMMYIIIRSYGRASIRLSERIKNPKEIKNILLSKMSQLDHVLDSGGHDRAFGVILDTQEPSDLVKFAKQILYLSDKILTEKKLI